jgi:hypothetical protein
MRPVLPSARRPLVRPPPTDLSLSHLTTTKSTQTPGTSQRPAPALASRRFWVAGRSCAHGARTRHAPAGVRPVGGPAAHLLRVRPRSGIHSVRTPARVTSPVPLTDQSHSFSLGTDTQRDMFVELYKQQCEQRESHKRLTTDKSVVWVRHQAPARLRARLCQRKRTGQPSSAGRGDHAILAAATAAATTTAAAATTTAAAAAAATATAGSAGNGKGSFAPLCPLTMQSVT